MSKLSVLKAVKTSYVQVFSRLNRGIKWRPLESFVIMDVTSSLGGGGGGGGGGDETSTTVEGGIKGDR